MNGMIIRSRTLLFAGVMCSLLTIFGLVEARGQDTQIPENSRGFSDLLAFLIESSEEHPDLDVFVRLRSELNTSELRGALNSSDVIGFHLSYFDQRPIFGPPEVIGNSICMAQMLLDDGRIRRACIAISDVAYIDFRPCGPGACSPVYMSQLPWYTSFAEPGFSAFETYMRDLAQIADNDVGTETILEVRYPPGYTYQLIKPDPYDSDPPGVHIRFGLIGTDFVCLNIMQAYSYGNDICIPESNLLSVVQTLPPQPEGAPAG